MKISIRDLRMAAEWIDHEGPRSGHPEDQQALMNAADYLRFVADQREEFEATRREADPRMAHLRNALQKVFSPRAERAAGRGG